MTTFQLLEKGLKELSSLDTTKLQLKSSFFVNTIKDCSLKDYLDYANGNFDYSRLLSKLLLCHAFCEFANKMSKTYMENKDFLLEVIPEIKSTELNKALRESKIDYKLLLNKEIAFAILKKDGSCMTLMPDSIRSNKDMVKEGVKTASIALLHADEALNEDLQFCIELLPINRSTWQHAGTDVRHSPEYQEALYTLSVKSYVNLMKELYPENWKTPEVKEWRQFPLPTDKRFKKSPNFYLEQYHLLEESLKSARNSNLVILDTVSHRAFEHIIENLAPKDLNNLKTAFLLPDPVIAQINEMKEQQKIRNLSKQTMDISKKSSRKIAKH